MKSTRTLLITHLNEKLRKRLACYSVVKAAKLTIFLPVYATLLPCLLSLHCFRFEVCLQLPIKIILSLFFRFVEVPLMYTSMAWKPMYILSLLVK